jgi:hypothetical protein
MRSLLVGTFRVHMLGDTFWAGAAWIVHQRNAPSMRHTKSSKHTTTYFVPRAVSVHHAHVPR